jgi:hypothetical protein
MKNEENIIDRLRIRPKSMSTETVKYTESGQVESRVRERRINLWLGAIGQSEVDHDK